MPPKLRVLAAVRHCVADRDGSHDQREDPDSRDGECRGDENRDDSQYQVGPGTERARLAGWPGYPEVGQRSPCPTWSMRVVSHTGLLPSPSAFHAKADARRSLLLLAQSGTQWPVPLLAVRYESVRLNDTAATVLFALGMKQPRFAEGSPEAGAVALLNSMGHQVISVRCTPRSGGGFNCEAELSDGSTWEGLVFAGPHATE
jgi:hypothetical protein